MIIQEKFGEFIDYSSRKSEGRYFVYYALVQDRETHTRYLKIGTTERGTARFNDVRTYGRYSVIRPLYMAEVSTRDEMMGFESLNRGLLIFQKGLSFVENDRFKFFKLPEYLPACFGLDEMRTIPVIKGERTK